MEVSIIILNYNTYNLTCQCIESILEHTKEISYEIILVDNASIECNPDKFKEKFPYIKLIKSPINTGFAGGNNIGIKEAIGKYILLLNSDTKLVEDSIGKTLFFYKSKTNIGVVSCKLKGFDDKVQPNAYYFTNWWRYILERFKVKKLLPKKLNSYLFLGFDFEYNRSIECDGVWGAFFLFEKSILRIFELKLLPVNFFMYFEDLDWCMSLKKYGYKNYFFNETYIYHIGGASSSGNILDVKTNLIKLSKLHNNYFTYLILKFCP